MKYKRNTLQRKLTVSFSLLFCAILIVICIAVSFHFYTLKDTQHLKMLQGFATQTALALDTYYSELENLITSTATNKTLYENWQSSQIENDYDALCNRQEIKNMFRTALQSRSDIANIAMFSENCYIGSDNYKTIGLRGDYLENVWNDFETSKSFKVQYYGLHTLDYQMRPGTEGSPEVISLVYPVRNIDQLSPKNDALLIFDLYYTAMSNQISRIDSIDADTILIDENNRVIYSTNRNNYPGEQMPALDNNAFPEYSWASAVLTTNGWKIVVLQPISVWNSEIVFTLLIIIGLFALLFVVMIITISKISMQFATPIISLSQQMALVDLEHHDAISFANGTKNVPYEIIFLYGKYNDLVQRIATLKMEKYEAILKQKEANYMALQAQINPHFLNNVLQTIQSLAVLNKPEEIQYITSLMGDWLEYTLYAKSDFATIFEEITHIKKYLQLYRYRLGTDFTYKIIIDESINNYIIPRFIIQPLVENAVLHGLNSVGEKTLTIEGQIIDDNILINVMDNGIGIDPDALEKIVSQLNHDSKPHSSLGLHNVNQRMKHLYGSSYGIEIQSDKGSGTCVTLIFPSEHHIDYPEKGIFTEERNL